MKALTFPLHASQLAAMALALAAWASPFKAVCAAGPKVGFDLGYAVECRDVTQQAFAMLHPDEKVIEANLRLTVRLERGEEADVEQLLFEISSPSERLRVIDFLPKTQLEVDAQDGVEVTKTTETIHSLGGSLGTNLAVTARDGKNNGLMLTQAMPAVNANTTHRNQTQETSKKIPQGKVVIASGTQDNEHGVFFKLKRSAVTPFEGVRTLSFRFVVPSDWRGDWVVLSAEAKGRVKRYFFKSVETCGQAKAFIGLYRAGDAEAERAALQLAEQQESYFANKSDKQCHDLAIAELALASRPWPASPSRTTREPAPFKIKRACYKPFDPFGLGDGQSDERATANAALKQTLDRVAKYSDAAEFRQTPEGVRSAMR
ncbi:MAG TPA: hypothetical protein VMV10_04370 [Pirellulales bacterium]|nr:hypothetical protein [Pirellulales bacterium]